MNTLQVVLLRLGEREDLDVTATVRVPERLCLHATEQLRHMLLPGSVLHLHDSDGGYWRAEVSS